MNYTELEAKHFNKNGKVDIKTHVEEEVFSKEMSSNIVAGRVVGNIYYAALKNGGEVVPVIVQTHISNDINRPMFGYYDMIYDDNERSLMHTDCPAFILDLLTPTTNVVSKEWRSRCNARIAQKNQQKSIRRMINNYPDKTEYEVTVFKDGDFVCRHCYKDNDNNRELYYVPERRNHLGQKFICSIPVKSIIECRIYSCPKPKQ